MKKIFKKVLLIISIILFLLGITYVIDITRIKNNKEVIFSTWRNKYFQVENSLNQNKKIYEVENDTNEDRINLNNSEKISNPYFFGTVIECTMSRMIVEVKEDDETRKQFDRCIINFPKDNDVLYLEGTNVKITYTGDVLEIYPPIIANVLDIETKSVDNFEIKFYKLEKEISILYKIVDSKKNEKYDYDVYVKNGNVNIIINEKEISLEEALKNNQITMEEIIKKCNMDVESGLIEDITYKDGGTKMYKYNNYTIIKKHTLNGNKDVYIGPENLSINETK